MYPPDYSPSFTTELVPSSEEVHVPLDDPINDVYSGMLMPSSDEVHVPLDDPIDVYSGMKIVTTSAVDKVAATDVMIASIAGTGSGEFLGSLLATIPRVFYVSEPIDMGQDKTFDSRLSKMKNVFECNYNQLTKFSCNLHGSGAAHGDEVKCMPDSMAELCKKSPLKVIKNTAMNFAEVESLLDVFDMKIILFLRDPRAIIHTLMKNDVLFGLESQSVPKELCPHINGEFVNAFEMKDIFPKQVKLVKYEELCLKPYETFYGVLDFLNIQPDEFLTRIIDRNVAFFTGETREAGQDIPADEDPWTYHDIIERNKGQIVSKEKATEWMNQLDPDIKSLIDDQCKKSLHLYNR